MLLNPGHPFAAVPPTRLLSVLPTSSGDEPIFSAIPVMTDRSPLFAWLALSVIG